MGERDSYCPWPPLRETTDSGTGECAPAGQEDPVELDSSPGLWDGGGGRAYAGAPRQCNTATPPAVPLTARRRRDRPGWGVWLGRRACYSATQAPHGGLRRDGNPPRSGRAKARPTAPASARRGRESAAYRSSGAPGTGAEVTEKLPQG